jgi:amidohydrolase
MPHSGVDPIVIAARVIEGIQLVRSRMINPLTPIVVSVCSIHGGNGLNIIPDEVTMAGTIRTLEPETRSMVHSMLERMAVDTARASGGEADFKILDEFPPTINEERSTAFARDVLIDILGPENVVEIKTSVMGGEDFSFYLEKIPGSFIMLGVGDKAPLHGTSFDFNDEALPFVIQLQILK